MKLIEKTSEKGTYKVQYIPKMNNFTCALLNGRMIAFSYGLWQIMQRLTKKVDNTTIEIFGELVSEIDIQVSSIDM